MIYRLIRLASSGLIKKQSGNACANFPVKVFTSLINHFWCKKSFTFTWLQLLGAQPANRKMNEETKQIMRNSIAFKRTKRFLNIRRKKESAVPHHNEMSNRNILKGFSNECEAVKLQAQPSSMFSLSRLTRWKFNRYMFHVTRWLQSNT